MDIATEGSIDPTAFIRPSLEAVDESLENGFNIVTPNSPFLNLIEAASSTTMAGMVKSQVLTRRQYKNQAQTYEDLYGHLSDRDFKGRFGNPGRSTINMALSYEWISQNAVTEPVTGDRHLILPKDTSIRVNGLDFYFHYDIKIHVLASGDVQVYFVENRESPIFTPTSLMLDTKEVYADNQRLVDITIPVEQLTMDVISSPITANGLSVSHILTDDFYYARAFIKNSGVWSEIATTHSQDVYDPSLVTMVMEVTDKVLNARIPDIYINSGSVGTEAKLLVYTTKGNIEQDLSIYGTGDFVVEFDDAFDANIDYWSVMSDNPLKIVYSTDKVSDGTNALTFEQLKDLVVYNKYGKSVAVTFDELKVSLDIRGYGIYKQKDTIAERVYVSTKKLAKPTQGFISSSASVSNKDVVIDVTRNDISNYLVNNGDISTLKPGALFRSTGFDVVLASDVEKAKMDALTTYPLCTELNNNQWYYTPFHYVLDSSSYKFRAAAYYLNNPESLTKSFVNFNPNLDYAVKTKEAYISFDGSKYTLTINSEHPSGLTGLHLQMKVTDSEGNDLHANASQSNSVGTSSDFVFVLETNLAINSDDRIQTGSLFDNTGTLKDTYLDLETEFEFIYLVEETAVTPSAFDSAIETVNITPTVSGVTYDKITFKFGDSLDNLNSLAKVVLLPGEVERHNTDVPLYYETDVFLKDSNGIVYDTDDDGKPIPTKLHSAGDPVLVDGEQRYKHKSGDPIIIDGKQQYTVVPYNARKVRLFLIDAKYAYATDTQAKDHANKIPLDVIEYLDDMKTYDPEMLERTTLLFEPMGTSNLSVVTVESGRQTTASTAIRFDVQFTMEEARYSDIQLRNSIIETTKKTIAEAIDTSEFSLSALTSELDKVASNVMRNVKIVTSLPSEAAAIADSSSTFSIRSRIVPTQNKQLAIEDDISIEITT